VQPCAVGRIYYKGWELMVVGEFYTATVVRYSRSGAVVTVEGHDGTELIHLSKISPRFVNNTSDFLSIGDVVSAECVSGHSRPHELSLLHLNLQPKIAENKRTDDDRRTETRPVSAQKRPPKPQTFEDMLTAVQSDFQDKQKDVKSRLRRRQRVDFIKR